MKHSSTKIIITTVILLIVIGAYYNSQQINQLKPALLNHDLPTNNYSAPRKKKKKQQETSCLKARKDTVHPSMFQKLPWPYVNLGFPKMGTSSLHAFFECGGLKSHHFQCGKDFQTNRRVSCAKCISDSVEANKPPLAFCEEADIYTQMDNGTYFPQVELLNEFHQEYPTATFFLTFRNMSKWFHSLSHWPPRPRGPHFNERLQKLNITGFPAGKGKNEEEFTEWYCNHVIRVRELVANSEHHLIEVDIEDNTIGQRMSEMFGISESCWGHANVNLNLHPAVNTSEVTLSKRGVKVVKNAVDKNVKSAGSFFEEIEDTADVGIRATESGYDSQFEDFDDSNDVDTAEIRDNGNNYLAPCFRARSDTVPLSMYGKLPKPWINLGLPKMGTTSLNEFFKCGNYTSYHYICCKDHRNPLLCANCTKQSVRNGLKPLANCPAGDAWTQLDNGRYFPQIELLEEFFQGYPRATFILMFRGMENWYNSMLNWPRNRNKYKPMTERLLKLNITGLPKGKGNDISVFADWHCGHVQRVRDVIAKYPAHLIEIDVEDPAAGQYLEDLFGIKQQCFGQKNANMQIEPTQQ